MTNSKLMACKTCSNEIAISANACPKCGAKNDWTHPKILEFVQRADIDIDVPRSNYRYNKNWIELRANRSTNFGICILKLIGTLFGLLLWELFTTPLKVKFGGMFVIAAGEIGFVLAAGYFAIMAVIGVFREFSTGFSSNDWDEYHMLRIEFVDNEKEPQIKTNNNELWKDVIQFFKAS